MSLNKIHDQLISLGYKSYPYYKKEVDAFYQKPIYTSHRKHIAYFINIEVYDFKLNGLDRVDLVAQAKFYRNAEDNLGFDASIPVENDISKMENFFADVYHRFDCVPDIHNND